MERPSAINRRKLKTRHKFLVIYPNILNKNKIFFLFKNETIKKT